MLIARLSAWHLAEHGAALPEAAKRRCLEAQPALLPLEAMSE